MDWSPSPSGTVWRKRLHLVGPPESGQVTSVVHYLPNATFPEHGHPDGEEILVLDGVFSDEHGDWPAGTFLLNPEGFRHAPYSAEGCLLFVKLRQFSGRKRRHVAVDTHQLEWAPGPKKDITRKLLYRQSGFCDRVYLERWHPGTDSGVIHYPQGAELFVLEGEFCDAEGTYSRGTWLRLPAGSEHRPGSERGCTLYVKTGGLPYLNAGTNPI